MYTNYLKEMTWLWINICCYSYTHTLIYINKTCENTRKKKKGIYQLRHKNICQKFMIFYPKQCSAQKTIKQSYYCSIVDE